MRWKPIENYDGLYLISDEGKIFSVRTEKILRTDINRAGYERVELNVNGIAQKHSVHRLVAENFIPNPDNLPCVNHKDENPRNNHADNLEIHRIDSVYYRGEAHFKAFVRACKGPGTHVVE